MESNAQPTAAKLNWPIFFIVLCAPVVVTVIAVHFGRTGQDAATAIAILGGALGGIICGAMLGRRIGTSAGMKIAMSFVFALMIIPVCVGMSCFGCLVSGFKLDFR